MQTTTKPTKNTPTTDDPAANKLATNQAVLRLTVKNHPGVMSHVCGLFTRRSYNLESIVVYQNRDSDGTTSRMWLLVNEDTRLEQVIRQTEKLVDVLDIEQHTVTNSVFEKMEVYG